MAATSESGGVPSAALEAAKLEALYHFAYGLSHEINNPLANISARAQALLVEETNPDKRRKLATIVRQAFRAHEMIADLMLFARPPALKLETVDLADLASRVAAELADAARDQGTSLTCSCDSPPLLARVDPTQIAVALKAIGQNALEAVQQVGEVEIRASQSPNSATLTVTDTGSGIPEEIRPHIFDPFFSGREAGRGLGLGLCKAWRIVTLHGGTIEVDCGAGQGAKIAIKLPRDSRAELATKLPADA